MAGKLEDQVAFVTGAARGQGRSHAVRMAAEGADIIAVDRCADLESVNYGLATEADLDETCALVEAQGRKVVRHVADVRDLAALTAAVEDGVGRFGRLDIAVANAGIASYGAGADLTEQQWDEMIDVNLSGVWRTARVAIPHIRAGGRGGCILMTSSVAGLRGIPHAAHYAASKHGVVGLVKVLALELGAEGIRVNAIHPTNVNTGMIRNDATVELFLPNPDKPRTEEAFARIAQQLNVLPVPWIEPEVVSETVVFLASEAGKYITGASIPVDAGMSQRW
ncbi:mycofactocin-coupled SDR family oxidoreductase [Amycolatopsis rhabdoformis]|uniref:Mycofactocin-coupled SDR family oxidoreductase n=1 Tax=Amycolatopsis rhabdoformis TaxID=1448059 RepID=A0ABZ1IG85_9PSEU|nr:mycofactocin-coupled SDR family oxidoreductase [Amycolatopsis rhabdoformis]WSE32569.1 mycofactocin-coupled SDR family oxidoreductase [Amycolatopsis rhabdoformis]